MALAVATNIPSQQPETLSHPTTPPAAPADPSFSRQASTSSDKRKSSTPNSQRSILKSSARSVSTQESDDATWGANFWVTLVDPQVSTRFFNNREMPFDLTKIKDTNLIFRVSSDWTSQLGPSCGDIRVMSYCYVAFHRPNVITDCHPVLKENGGSSAMSRGGVCRITIRLRRERQYGRDQVAS